MAINKNHEFEDLDGVKCAIVERNVIPARVEFLKKLLELNNYKVIVVKSPPPKTAPPVDPNNPHVASWADLTAAFAAAQPGNSSLVIHLYGFREASERLSPGICGIRDK